MSDSATPQGASSKPTRTRKSAASKPRKSRSKAAEPAAQTQAQDQASPAPPAQAPEAEVVVRTIQLTAVDRASMVATAAYYRAEHRRFAAGHELEDWLAAEAEIEALVRAQRARSS